jgi:hypothetical protein
VTDLMPLLVAIRRKIFKCKHRATYLAYGDNEMYIRCDSCGWRSPGMQMKTVDEVLNESK